MALQGDITTFAGVIIEDQYIKIEDVTVSKGGIKVQVGYYRNKTQSDEGMLPYEVTTFERDLYRLDGENPLVQGYELLKEVMAHGTKDV